MTEISPIAPLKICYTFINTPYIQHIYHKSIALCVNDTFFFLQGTQVFTSYEGGFNATGNYKGRISLVPPDSPYGKGSINLTNIRESDGGWYECSVFFPNRTPSTRPNGTWFHLNVEGKSFCHVNQYHT